MLDRDGTGASSGGSSRGRRAPVDALPFHVVEVQPGITMTAGGLAVDEEMRVLSRAGSRSPLPRRSGEAAAERAEPLPGLFATGADVGNVHNGGYLGGLATALVTGRIVGASAVERAR